MITRRLRAAIHELRCTQCRVTWKSWLQRLLGDHRGMTPKRPAPGLPEMRVGMGLDQALFLELLSMLVDEHIISVEKAVKRYLDRKKKFGREREVGHNWDAFDNNFPAERKS